MNFPPILEFGLTSIIYLIMIYIASMGFYQFYLVRIKNIAHKKSFVPLGAIGLIFGILSYVNKMRQSFEAISEAGDISPALIAGSISEAFAAPTLGLLCLALAYFFKFINQ